jgi:hypothetical protein
MVTPSLFIVALNAPSKQKRPQEFPRPQTGSLVSDPRSQEHRDACQVDAELFRDGISHHLQGSGSGPVDAFIDALRRTFDVDIEVTNYAEHALSSGSDAEAVAYVELTWAGDDGRKSLYGVDVDSSIVGASIRALVAALNRIAASIDGGRAWPEVRGESVSRAGVGGGSASPGVTLEVAGAARTTR